MPYKLLVILITFTSVYASAQSLMKKNAEKYYQQLAYIDAVDFYEKLVNKKLPQEDDLRKISDCYIKLLNYPKAEVYLKQLISLYPNTVTEADLISCLQALKYNKHYTEVSSVITALTQKKSTHSLLRSHQLNPDYLSDLKADSSRYVITQVEGLNTSSSEFSPVSINNHKQLLFTSNRRNVSMSNEKFSWDDTYFLDILQADQVDSVHFKNVHTFQHRFISKYHDGPIALSEKDNTMYLTRSQAVPHKTRGHKPHIINLKLFILNYDSISNTWGEPVSFPYNSDDYSVGHASVTEDGKRLYFISDMPGGYGQTDIWMCNRVNNTWGQPENLGPSVNTEGREMFPYVHKDGTLFFASDGRAGLGGLDLYMTPYTPGSHVEPQNLGYPVNSNDDDFSIFLNDHVLSGYLSSSRSGITGKDDIFYFHSKTALQPSFLGGSVKDEISGQIIPSTKVYLQDRTSMRLDSCVADTSGRYAFSVNPKHLYELRIKETMDYYDLKKDSLLFNTSNDLLVTPKYRLAFKIIDSKTNQPLYDVQVHLKNNETNEIRSFKTNNKGSFQTIIRNKHIGDSLSIELKLEKDEYITIIEDINLILDSSSIIELENPMEFNLEKIARGINLAKVIHIKPIYFDKAKWNVRPDAAIELNRIVMLMNENPTIKIESGSHTDCRSSDAYNLKLSTLRAKSVTDYLISKGIDKSRLTSKGYGEKKPVSACACEGARLPECTEEQHQLNRRTEFLITDF